LLARGACAAFVAFNGFVAAARVAGSLAALRVLAATGSSAAERLVRELLLRVILGRGRSTLDKNEKEKFTLKKKHTNNGLLSLLIQSFCSR